MSIDSEAGTVSLELPPGQRLERAYQEAQDSIQAEINRLAHRKAAVLAAKKLWGADSEGQLQKIYGAAQLVLARAKVVTEAQAGLEDAETKLTQEGKPLTGMPRGALDQLFPPAMARTIARVFRWTPEDNGKATVAPQPVVQPEAQTVTQPEVAQQTTEAQPEAA